MAKDDRFCYLGAIWTRESIRVVALSDHGIDILTEVPQAYSYDIGLGVLGCSRHRGLIVKAYDGGRSHFVFARSGSLRFTKVNPVPGRGELSHRRCKIHSNGVLTAIESPFLWVLRDGHDHWERIEGPEEFDAHDISFDRAGSLHLVGARVGERHGLPWHTPEYWVYVNGRFQPRPLALGWIDRIKLDVAGGVDWLDEVYAETDPIVVLADASTFLDDLSSYVILRAQKWKCRRLQSDFVISVVRHACGRTTLFTEGLGRLVFDRRGKLVEHTSLANAAARAGVVAGPRQRLELDAAYEDERRCFYSVHIWDYDKDDWLTGPAAYLCTKLNLEPGLRILGSVDAGRAYVGSIIPCDLASSIIGFRLG